MGFRRKVDTHEPTKVPTPIEIAWAAGVYEGEGCCQNYNAKNRRCTARVTQKDPELLYRLRDWFGGSVVKQGHCMAWLACGDRSRYFLALIYPFMTARRKEQVDRIEALAFLNGLDPAMLSSAQIATLLDSRPARSRRSDALDPEEARRRRSESVKKYYATNPEYRERQKLAAALRREAKRAQQSFEALGNHQNQAERFN